MTKSEEKMKALEDAMGIPDAVPTEEQVQKASECWRDVLESPYRVYADKDFQAGALWAISLMLKNKK